MTTTPSKSAQDKEAADRERTRVAGKNPPPGPGETTEALAGIGDTDADTTRQQQQDAADTAVAKPPPVTLTPGDDKRAGILARSRVVRAEEDKEARENAAELHQYTRGGIPPEMQGEPPIDPIAAEDAAEINDFVDKNRPTADGQDAGDEGADGADAGGDEGADGAAEKPVLYRLKVHGSDVEMTLEDILAEAQKSLAANNLLEDAKRQAKEAADLLREAQGVTGANRGRNQATEDGQTADDGSQSNQGVDLKDVVEALMMEPSEVAVEKLQALLDERDARIEAHLSTKSKDDISADKLMAETNRSKRALAQFTKANAAFMGDKHASRLAEAEVFDQFAADLVKIGITPDTMAQQQNGRPPTAKDYANWHQWYRANQPEAVRSIERIFEDAKAAVIEAVPQFKGGQQQQQQGDPRPKPAVVMDRSGRRSVLQPQPQRSAAPRAPTPAGAPQIDRTATAKKIIDQRNTLRGRVAVN